MGHLCPLDAVQHGVCLNALLLGAINAQNVRRGHHTEQRYGHNGADYADADRSLDAFTHDVKSSFIDFAAGTAKAPQPSARGGRRNSYYAYYIGESSQLQQSV